MIVGDVVAEEEGEVGVGMVNLSAIGVTGLVTLLVNVPRGMAEILEEEALSATVVTGLVTLLGSVQKVTVVVMEVAVVVEEEVEVSAVAGTLEVEEAPNATSATGLATSPVNAVRRRTAVTSAMVLGILPETAARTRIPVTTVMRWDTS